MKHYLFAFLLALTASLLIQHDAFAQKKSTKVSLSLGGGVNLSSAQVGGYYDRASNATSRFSFGFFADKKIKGGLSARSGFFYNGLGREYVQGYMGIPIPDPGDMHMQDEFNYFTIPLQVKYSFRDSPFSLYAGPQFSYLINVTWRPESNTRSLITDQFQRSNVSAAGGLLCAFTNRFSMGFEYQSSIGSNLDEGYKANLPTDTKYELYAFSLRAFYKLSN
ncbi:MAG: PorT family protein [Bacteroidetes bacterium]|nr:PorT family protein [Bacteroidota bacterium]